MNAFNEVSEKLSLLTADELEEIKIIADKILTEKRFDELAKAYEEAKLKNENYKLKYYQTGEDLLAALNTVL